MRAAGAYVGCSGSGAAADRYDPAPLGYPGAACLPATAARLLDHYSGPHPGVPPRPTGWSSRPVDRVTRGSTHEPGLPHSRPWETVPSLVGSTEASRPNAVIERMPNNAHHAGQMQATAPPTPAVEGSVRWAWRRAGLPISAPCCGPCPASLPSRIISTGLGRAGMVGSLLVIRCTPSVIREFPCWAVADRNRLRFAYADDGRTNSRGMRCARLRNEQRHFRLRLRVLL
jgi:hypothetical protein